MVGLVGIRTNEEITIIFLRDVSGKSLSNLTVNVVALLSVRMFDEIRNENGRERHRSSDSIGNVYSRSVLKVLVERFLRSVSSEDNFAGVVELRSYNKEIRL